MENKSFRPDIEGLRGIAILLVVAYHAGMPGFTGGFVGVDVFFALSGYLITGLLVAEREKKGKISLANFYARRAKRLLPASFVVILFTLFFTYIIFAPFEQQGIFKTAFTTALYFSNFYFLTNSTNYFADTPETNPFLHTWSLSVEEQFYLVFPLLILLALKYGSRRLLLTIITFSGFVSFISCVYLTEYRQGWAFFSSPTRAWEFAAGALGVIVAGFHSKRMGTLLGWGGLVLILGAAVFYGSKTPFPGWAALVPVIGTIAVLRSGSDSPAGKILSNSILQFFGRLSYSFYLWHWIALVFAAALWNELSLPERLLCVLISLGIAQISYTFIEKPVRFSAVLARRPSYGLIMAAVLTLIGAAGSFYLYRLAETNRYKPEQLAFYMAREVPLKAEVCSSKFAETSLKECVFGNFDSDKTVVLMGDSHLYQWFLPLQEIAERENWRLVTFFKNACTPVDVPFFYKGLGRRYYECEQWRENAFARIKEIHPYLIIASGFERVSPIDRSEEIPLERWTAGLTQTFDAFNASGAKVVYLRDTPFPGFDPLKCVARTRWQSKWIDTKGACTFQRDKALNDELAEAEKSVAENKKVAYIDMNIYICPGKICEPTTDGNLIYRDAHHLTNDFALRLGTFLNDELKKRNLIGTNEK